MQPFMHRQTASAKYKTPHSTQHYCVPPKVMKTAPTPLIYLVQNATLLFQTWTFKKVFTEKSLFYASHPDFSHRGASQVEQLNSYNSPVQLFYQEKTQTPHLPSLSSLNFRLILLRICAHQICICQQSLSMFPMMKRDG